MLHQTYLMTVSHGWSGAIEINTGLAEFAVTSAQLYRPKVAKIEMPCLLLSENRFYFYQLSDKGQKANPALETGE